MVHDVIQNECYFFVGIMESKLLQLFDSVSERLDHYSIESYKSIGVPFDKLGSTHRTQMVQNIVAEHGTDYLTRPEHVFSRVVQKYVCISISGNSASGKNGSGNDEKYSFISFAGKAINNFLHTDDEMLVTQYRYVPTTEMDHRVLFENAKKNASFGTSLGNVLNIIRPRIAVDPNIFSDRMINMIIGRKIVDESEPKYDIFSEIECLFDESDSGAVDRVMRYYKNCLTGQHDTLWITMPPKDMKIRDLFNAINIGMFGPDAEMVERSGYGNYLSASVVSRYRLNNIFGTVFGPIGPMIIQNRMYDPGIIAAAQLAPCMFICPMVPAEDSKWSYVDRLDIPDTIGYKLPRGTQGKKFSANEIYDFVERVFSW